LKTDIKQSDCVLWYSVRCPFCNSPRTKVTNSNQKPYRYNKCLDCKEIFQSYEANYEPHKPPYDIPQKKEERRQKLARRSISEGGTEAQEQKTGEYLVDNWERRAQV